LASWREKNSESDKIILAKAQRTPSTSEITNPKFEIRNSKQIQMAEKYKFQNIPDSDSAFWIFRV
jgi:hypothetical protein